MLVNKGCHKQHQRYKDYLIQQEQEIIMIMPHLAIKEIILWIESSV